MARRANPNKENNVNISTKVTPIIRTRFKAYCESLQYSPSPSTVLAHILEKFLNEHMSLDQIQAITEATAAETAKTEAPAETAAETAKTEAPAETAAETAKTEAPAETAAETAKTEATDRVPLTLAPAAPAAPAAPKHSMREGKKAKNA